MTLPVAVKRRTLPIDVEISSAFWNGLDMNASVRGDQLQRLQVFELLRASHPGQGSNRFHPVGEGRDMPKIFLDVLLATPEIESALTRAGISNARVEAALDSIYSILKSYNSLCYFRIQKKVVAKQKKSR